MIALAMAVLGGFAAEQQKQEQTPAQKRVAVFVQNRTRVPGMDNEVDGIRDRLSAALAEVEGIVVLDSAQIADTFRKYKVTVEEEKTGLMPGIFTGGSVPNVARMIGCDYIVAATVVSASSVRRNIAGSMTTVFNLRMSVKVMDAAGASVCGIPVKPYTFPVVDAVDDPMNYYNILLDQWSTDTATALAQAAPKWRKPSLAATALVSFSVKTTIDQTIADLESQTKGAKDEDLAVLRKVVGGVTIELDGAVIGSAPNTFKAAPGLHQLRVTREWMKPYQATVNIQEGMQLHIALEMSSEGVAKWGTLEALRADVAKRYADAAMTRGIKINVDTTKWRDVGTTGAIKIDK